MAQSSILSLANSLSSAFRSNLNGVLAALFSTNSGASFPTVTAPGMLHVNTAGGGQVLWMRNAADNAWVQVSFGSNDLLTLGALSLGAPVIKTANFAVAMGENWLVNNKGGSICVVTLPAPAANTGRTLMIQNLQSQTVVSAAANVLPQGGGGVGTAILPAGAGAWAVLVSDGVQWRVVQSSTAPLGFTPLEQGGGVGMGANKVRLGWRTDGLGLQIQVDSTPVGTVVRNTSTPAGVNQEMRGDGSPPLYACRAWVNFNGVGGASIRGSGNVSSVSRNGVGDYTVNFAVAMPDASYSVVLAGSGEINVNHTVGFVTTLSAGSVRVRFHNTGNSGNLADQSTVCISIFR